MRTSDELHREIYFLEIDIRDKWGEIGDMENEIDLLRMELDQLEEDDENT